MSLHLRGLCLLGIGLLTACTDLPPAEEEASSRGAVADPVLCEEHGVLESVCPKCNPRLAAIFQARGDWCGEHGFPESFCPVCAPEKGGQPDLQPTAADGAPADGTLVRFRTRAVAAQAGLEIVAAEESDWVEGTEVVARLTWDATRVAAVSARAPGVVDAILAEEGDRVSRGQALAKVRSAHVASDRSRLAAAEQARGVAAAAVDRKRELLAGGVAAERDVLDAEQVLAGADAELAAVRAELAIIGRGQGDALRLTAPIAGVVTARRVHVGQSVDGLQPLFEVVDTSRMWAVLDVPERDLSAVAAGHTVQLRLDALPGEVFGGEITTISPSVDPDTRTAAARVELDNADGRLRANLFGTVTILGDTAAAAVVVPAAAVQRAGDFHLVFVQQQVDTYVVRRVRVLARQGDRVRVSGVSAGDPVVTTGSFLLKTETLKDSIGAGCCDVDEP